MAASAVEYAAASVCARDVVRAEKVSFDHEDLILVDELDQVTGYDSKFNAHRGAGLLHRAFSIFLFDGPEWVLLQQRSTKKPLWPSYWANSCCSHPRRGETCDDAVHRRLREELGAEASLQRLYSFQYRASYLDRGTEHELCTVYAGQYGRHQNLRTNTEEVRAWGWFSRDQVNDWVSKSPEVFAPWFLLEWRQLQDNCQSRLQQLFS